MIDALEHPAGINAAGKQVVRHALVEIQERRKADREPVAEVVSIYGDHEAFGEREIRPLIGIQQMPYGTKLYRHAQPAPVAPVCTCPSGDGSLRWPCPVYPGNSPVIPDGWKMVPIDATRAMIDAARRVEEDGYDAMHKAMLAAAPQSPGNEPATVPGKWIPVSERMPEDSGRYWCYVEEQNDLGKSHYQWNCSWNGDQWWVESENGGIVTHWMPLTASPQEAINALISVVSRNEPEGN